MIFGNRVVSNPMTHCDAFGIEAGLAAEKPQAYQCILAYLRLGRQMKWVVMYCTVAYCSCFKGTVGCSVPC